MRLYLEAQEEAESQGHPMLSTAGGGDVDVTMQMLWDWNHVISLNLTNSTASPVV